MQKYHNFLQQINTVQVKPPTFDHNMRVQRMRVELEKNLNLKDKSNTYKRPDARLSSLEFRAPIFSSFATENPPTLKRPENHSSIESSIERPVRKIPDRIKIQK